jgi:hypothetical protein
MAPKVVPALPDQSELRTLYNEAINDINAVRGSSLLTTAFYTKIADAMFATG